MKHVRTILQVIGALAVLGLVLALGAAIVLAPKFTERTDAASHGDVEAIFQWSGLDPKQPFTLLHSYQSAWEMDGDHRDWICVQLEGFTAGRGWAAGPETNPLMAQARTLAGKRGEGARCFGREVDGNAAEISAFILIAQTYLRSVDGAQIAFYDAATKRLLYSGFHD